MSPELEAVLLKALAKEPSGRYPTGAALADALDQALRARPKTVLPPPTLSRLSIPERIAVELAEHPLPPLPATVTPLPRRGESPATGEPATSPPSTSIGRRPTTYLIAAGLILAAVTICLVAGLLLFWRQNSPGEGAAAGVPGSTPSAESTATLLPTVTPADTPLATATPASYTGPVEAPLDCGAPATVFADADTWIDQNSSSNNFGTDSILKVRSQGPSDNFRALVRFTLPTNVPQGCVVQSATLRLYAASAAPDRTLQASGIADGWSENDVTWSNQPQTSDDAATIISTVSGYWEWDVTAQVQTGYDAGVNQGFLIRDANEGNSGSEQQFHSREKGENPPMLVITFTSLANAPPMPTPPAAITPVAPAEEPPAYELLIMKRGEDSLFVVNQSSHAFPLAPLSLGDDKGVINGSDWGVTQLDSGACVAAWKDGGNPDRPNVTCTEVGQHLTHEGEKRFWKDEFNVYYNGQLIVTCPNSQEGCPIRISQ